MLTEAMKRYLKNPPSNWDKLDDKTKQYYRNIEVRIRRHIKDATDDMSLLKASLTPVQFARLHIITAERVDASVLSQTIEVGLDGWARKHNLPINDYEELQQIIRGAFEQVGTAQKEE